MKAGVTIIVWTVFAVLAFAAFILWMRKRNKERQKIFNAKLKASDTEKEPPTSPES